MNADFYNNPRCLPNGAFYATDVNHKFSNRNYFKNIPDKTVFVSKSEYFKTVSKSSKKGKKEENSSDNEKTLALVPRTLEENYENLFNSSISECVKDNSIALKNLFSCIDVRQFGIAFPITGCNISITGAVQVYKAFNTYDKTHIEDITIMSPYRLSSENKNDKLSSTLGSKTVLDEAHFAFPFTINPSEYNKWIDLGVTSGYTEEDYSLLKDGMNRGVTSYDSASKAGCENEYSVFIKIKEGSNLYIPSLNKLIKFEKGKGTEKDTVHFNFGQMLNRVKDSIESVEIYYNPYILNVEFDVDLDNVQYKDIISYQELKNGKGEFVLEQ